MVGENQNKQKIIELREQGVSYGHLAKLFDLSRARIHQICSGYKNPKFNSEIKNLHNSILVRDGFVCQWGISCKDKNVSIRDLIVHYVDFDNENNSTDNLITLCKFCHAAFHAKNHIDEKILKNLSINHIRKIRVCPQCGKEFLPPSHSNRKTCSDECSSKSHCKKYKDKREKNRVLAAKYYNEHKNSPEFKEKIKGYNKKNHLKNWKNYYAKNKEKITERHKKYILKNIDKYRKIWRENAKRRYQKLKEKN